MEPLARQTAVIIPISKNVNKTFFAIFIPCQEKMSICFQVFFFTSPYEKNITNPKNIA